MRDKLDILALVLGTLGFICLAYSVLLPRWYVSVYERTMHWVGPWMGCTWGVELQCDVDRRGDLLRISIPLWIGTALALSAVLVSGLAMRGTNCCGDNVRRKLFTGGCLYLLSWLVALGPVMWFSWILVRVWELKVTGECVYLAWVSVGLLMTAGVLQLHRYSPCRRKEEVSHNCTPPLEHEGEEERCGEDGEPVCETAQQEMVCLNKYERTAGDSVTEPARKDSKRQYV